MNDAGINPDIIMPVSLLLFLYVLPSFIAWRRKHPNTGSVLLINLFLGWTVIGWFAAFIWSLVGNKPARTS